MDPNSEDAEGATPLECAVRAGQEAHAIALAAMGGDPYRKNRQGLTAIRMARRMGWTDSADMLEEAFSAWTNAGRSATIGS